MPPILKIVWFFLPAAAANMAPVFVRNFPLLAAPVDFGRNVFGDNKTWRGIFFGLAVAIVVAIIQDMIAANVFYSANVFYPSVAGIAENESGVGSSAIRGLLLGIGALGGDLLKSFFKRRVGIAPGKSWPIADQIDWVLGVLLVSYIFYSKIFFDWSTALIITTLLLFGSLHVLTNIAGYYLGMRKQPI